MPFYGYDCPKCGEILLAGPVGSGKASIKCKTCKRKAIRKFSLSGIKVAFALENIAPDTTDKKFKEEWGIRPLTKGEHSAQMDKIHQRRKERQARC